MQNFQILIVWAVKFCKHVCKLFQSQKPYRDFAPGPHRGLPLPDFRPPDTVGNSPQNESSHNLVISVIQLLSHSFLPERDYVTFGSLLSQFRLSSVVCL